MKIAVVGCDAELFELVRLLVSRHGAELTMAWGDANWRTRWQTLAPDAVGVDDWQVITTDPSLDLVVIGRERDAQALADDAQVAILKRFVQEGATILVSHPACSAIAALELDMIRRDTKARILVHFPGARHPALEALAQLVAAGEEGSIGRVEQVVFERTLAQRDRTTVLEQFARDAYVMRQIAGRINRVGATSAHTGDAAWASLGIQMTGDGQMLLRWSVEPGDPDRGGRVVLIGARGRATLEMRRNADWSLTTSTDEQQRTYSRDDVDRSAVTKLLEEATQADNDWPGVCRDLDVADLVETSLRRGRMLELHHDTVTEEDTFKGVMSAVGCLLLLLVPLVMIAAVVIDGFVHGWHTQMDYDRQGASGMSSQSSGGNIRFWLILILVPLLLFLMLQTLQLVFRRSPKNPGADGS